MSVASYRTSVSESGPPISLESERRKTMKIVHRVEKDIIAFREKYLSKVKTDFPDDMQDFVQFVVDRNQCKRYPRNTKEFMSLLSKVRDSAEVVYKTEMNLIDSAFITYNAFQDAIEAITSKIKEALDEHVGKYCHSFSAEAGSLEISSVQFYENNITRWRGQIKEAFTLLDDIMRNIRDMTINFEGFLQNYPRVVHYMGLSLEVFPRIFNALKDWVTSDEVYVRRLLEDMSELKREKMNIDNIARRHRLAAGGIQSKVTRSQHHTKKLKERLTRARDERRQCRKREIAIVDDTKKLEKEIQQKRGDYEKTMEKLYRKEGASKSARATMFESSGRLGDEIIKLEKKMNSLKVGLRNSKMERIAAQKEFHRMQVLCDKNTKIETDIQDDAHDASQDVRDLEEERRTLGEKVMALARIRAIKTHPQTLKVIYAEGFTPGRKFDVSDPLEEACRVAAADIGRDWPALYQQLPFSPRRDSGIRHQDIEGIEAGSQGADNSRGAAYKSLEKWSRFSQEASVNALTRTLRSMKKQEMAEKVEKKIVTVN